MHTLMILKATGLHITPVRLCLLEMFLQADSPLQLSNIMARNTGFNRITIYRALRTFVKAEILHVIPSKDEKIRYILAQKTNVGKAHPHFVCEGCHSVVELEDCKLPCILLPEGYQVNSLEIMVNGKCYACVQKM